jgi:hypothetical protein
MRGCPLPATRHYAVSGEFWAAPLFRFRSHSRLPWHGIDAIFFRGDVDNDGERIRDFRTAWKSARKADGSPEYPAS